MTPPRSIDVGLGADRCLRLTLVSDEHGMSVVFASGFGGAATGRAFSRPSWGEPPLTLPASCLPELVAALEELAR